MGKDSKIMIAMITMITKMTATSTSLRIGD